MYHCINYNIFMNEPESANEVFINDSDNKNSKLMMK